MKNLQSAKKGNRLVHFEGQSTESNKIDFFPLDIVHQKAQKSQPFNERFSLFSYHCLWMMALSPSNPCSVIIPDIDQTITHEPTRRKTDRENGRGTSAWQWRCLTCLSRRPWPSPARSPPCQGSAGRPRGRGGGSPSGRSSLKPLQASWWYFRVVEPKTGRTSRQVKVFRLQS